MSALPIKADIHRTFPRCLLWVISCCATSAEARLRYPRKQPRQSPNGLSAKGHEKTPRPFRVCGHVVYLDLSQDGVSRGLDRASLVKPRKDQSNGEEAIK